MINKNILLIVCILPFLGACGGLTNINKVGYENSYWESPEIKPEEMKEVYNGDEPGYTKLPCYRENRYCFVTPENDALLRQYAEEQKNNEEITYSEPEEELTTPSPSLETGETGNFNGRENVPPPPPISGINPPENSSVVNEELVELKKRVSKLEKRQATTSGLLNKLDYRVAGLMILSSNGKPKIMRVLGYKPGTWQTSQANVKFVISQLKQLKQAYPSRQISIDLYGSADKSGNPQKNQKIAEKRAKWFAKQITNANIGVKINNVVGLGSTEASIYNGKNRCVYVVPSVR